MKILIGLDASAHSERALEFVTRMRWPAGSRVIVLTVLQPVTSAVAAGWEPIPVAPGLLEERRRQLEEIIAGAENTLREAGLSTEGRIVEGDPRSALVDIARTERADVLVVGSHGRTGMAKLMLGSVSSHVVTHAPCSVLVVKQTSGR